MVGEHVVVHHIYGRKTLGKSILEFLVALANFMGIELQVSKDISEAT
jgi:hypothetical protein